MGNGCIKLGVAFLNLEAGAMELLAQFALFGTLPPTDGTIEKKYSEVKTSIGALKSLGSAIRIEIVSRSQDYYGSLRVRYQAYSAAEKLDRSTTLEDMADEYDAHSIVIIAKADNAVVGTVRMVEWTGAGQKFPFENYFDFSTVDNQINRHRYYEVSRLAVDPKFQGTDIIVKLFKEVARITCVNPGKTTICLSTRALRKMYKRIGFYEISEEVPHPVLTGEALAVLKVDSEEFLRGSRMSAHAWDKVAKEVYENIFDAEVIDLKINRSKVNLRLKIEKLLLGAQQLFRKKGRR
jgi:N-acyl-L-homoserine lactone synthetase